MPRPDDVGVGIAALIIRNKKILLLKRQGAHAAGLWAVPGGWIDRNDQNLILAVKRQVQEEVQLDVSMASYTPFRVTTEAHPEFRSVTLYYRCNAGEQVPKIMEPNKCSGLMWFSWGNIMGFDEDQFFPGLCQVLSDLYTEGVLK